MEQLRFFPGALGELEKFTKIDLSLELSELLYESPRINVKNSVAKVVEYLGWLIKHETSSEQYFHFQVNILTRTLESKSLRCEMWKHIEKDQFEKLKMSMLSYLLSRISR